MNPVCADFLSPPFGAAFRPMEHGTLMLMPETSLNKNNGFVFRENKIRFAGQICCMQPVTETGLMQAAAHQHFRPGIFALNCGHIPAAGSWVMYVSHFRITLVFMCACSLLRTTQLCHIEKPLTLIIFDIRSV